MTTEHPGMGSYHPDETGGPQGDEPTTRIDKPENHSAAGGSTPAPPNPTLPMPSGQSGPIIPPSPLGGLGYPEPLTPASDVGGTVYPPPDHPQGSIRVQEPGVTQPRPPTVAEARARDKARKRAEEAEQAAAAAYEAKRKKRKRMLIGGAAVVGVAAVVGAGYLAYENSARDVTAYCVTDDNNQQTVVNDNDCVAAQDYATRTGVFHSGLPAIFFFNGHQYRYYYGGSNSFGHTPVGGSLSEPSHARISTKSGTVIRGGLGSHSGGHSGRS